MKLSDRISAFVFPRRCPYCLSLIEPGEPACPKCIETLLAPRKPFLRGVYGCRMVSSLRYDGKVREAIINMKFNERIQFIPQFAQVLGEDVRRVFPGESFDAIVYVPMHPIDRRERGFNQCELLAQQLSKALSIPCADVLIKVKHTPKQHDLKGAERRRNLKNAFRQRKGMSVKGLRLLLIDDIITTGATLSECIRTLNKDAPLSIHCATLAAATGDVNFDTNSDSY